MQVNIIWVKIILPFKGEMPERQRGQISTSLLIL